MDTLQIEILNILQQNLSHETWMPGIRSRTALGLFESLGRLSLVLTSIDGSGNRDISQLEPKELIEVLIFGYI